VPPSSLTAALIDQFSERLVAVGGQVARAAASDAVVTLIGGIAESTGEIWASTGVTTAAPELVESITHAGTVLRTPTGPGEVRDQPVGLALAHGAIAETGSVILVEPRVADRAVTLITQTLIVLCPVSGLVPTLDEAAGILREVSRDGASYATFVTGPSRTADIERELTIGVQGPGALHVILVDDLR
jgi:L-lactate dehydrogenase complex protein LldG